LPILAGIPSLFDCDRELRQPASDAVVIETVADVPEAEEQPDMPLDTPLENPKIVIYKSEHKLELFDGETRVRSYRIGLGFSPVGDKEREGDGKTPEGEFYICMKNPDSSFHLSLGISYPNIEDAERGLRDELINQSQHDQIVNAINNHGKPPWNTALGGEIFIHGSGSGSDWTLGCIALDNDHIEELYEVIPVGTPITINP
jgi:murein L,D-transpeptidase YafK